MDQNEQEPGFLSAARYGKQTVKLLRVVRNGPRHEVVEYIVKALLEGEIEASYTQADNSVVVATDSMKNTINVKAKTSPYVLEPEKFALELGIHFVSTYKHIHKAWIDVQQLRWSRLSIDGQEHNHSFTRDGEDKRIVSVVVDDADGKQSLRAQVKGGITDLLVLKSTGSSFENFVRDEFTTLVEVDDRIFSTAVDASYVLAVPHPMTNDFLAQTKIDFNAIHNAVRNAILKIFATDDSKSVQATLYRTCQVVLKECDHVTEMSMALPNKHYVPVDLSFYKGLQNTKPADAEVFQPIEVSGLITATVKRR
ncbi:uricase [Atractiella rhizophila]|nr:uricase [Atractiella rhizophila]